MLMHVHVNFKKYRCGFQTLYIISMSMRTAHAFIRACWCSSATSLHLRDFATFDVILAQS